MERCKGDETRTSIEEIWESIKRNTVKDCKSSMLNFKVKRKYETKRVVERRGEKSSTVKKAKNLNLNRRKLGRM